MAKYNSKGQEIPDQTPVEMPIGHHVPEPLESMIARMVRLYSVQAVKEGMESFEEADDLDIPDDEPVSDHQMTNMQEERPAYKPFILKKEQNAAVPSAAEVKPPAPPAEPAAALEK